MRLANATSKLVPKDKSRARQPAPQPKKTGRTVNNPEQTPQEPKGRVNRRDRARRANFSHARNAGE